MTRGHLIVVVLLAGIASLGSSSRAADAPLPAGKVEGTVTNLSVDKTEKVDFVLSSEKDDTKVRAKGKYGNKQLFGTFDVTGKVVSRTDETTSLQFKGVIEFGDDGSGFPKGTKAEYVMTLLVSKKEIKGVYRIAPLPDSGLDFEQHGIMDLKLTK